MSKFPHHTSTRNGGNPYVYPANDWYDIMFNNFTSNQRFNMNLSGGEKVARYYLAASLNNDNGNLKRYMLRTNVNINVTKTTEVKVRLQGTFDDYKGPLAGGDQLYEKAMYTNPVLFPPYYAKNEGNEHTKHILFGNYDKAQFMNPYAENDKRI